MNLDNTLAELEVEATLVNDAIIAIQRLREYKGSKRKSPAKPRRKAPAKGKPKRKAKPRFGATEAVISIVKKKPGTTQADLVARVGTKQEKKSVQNAIYNAVHRKQLKRASDGGLTYIGA